MNVKTHLKKGDEVVVIAGKDKGRKGKIQRVLKPEGAVIVEGLNLAKKHAKPTKTNPQGGVIDKSLSVPYGKVMMVCSGCSQPTRIHRERAVDGTLVRVCKKCGRTLD